MSRPLSLPQDIAGLAAAVLAGPPSAGATRVVAVEGPSGSGKSVFAARLAADLGAPVVAMDDLYPGWAGLAAGIVRLRDEVLGPVAAGRSAWWRRWDWATGAPGDRVALVPGPALVIDGVGSGGLTVTSHLALIVWREAPDDVRRRRALDRDGPAYGREWERWAAQERTHFAVDRTSERAHVVVSGAEDPAWTWRSSPDAVQS